MASGKTKKLYLEIPQTLNRSDYALTPIQEEPDFTTFHNHEGDTDSQYIQHAEDEVERSSEENTKDDLVNDFVEFGANVTASNELKSPLEFASQNDDQKVARKATPFRWTEAANNDINITRIPRIRSRNLERKPELESVVNVDDSSIGVARNTKTVRDLLDELDRIEGELDDPRTQLDDAKRQGLVNLRRMVLAKNSDIEKFKVEMSESVHFLEQTVRIQLMELELMKGQVKNLFNHSSDCVSVETVACASKLQDTLIANDNGEGSSDNVVSENNNETISVASSTESVRWLEKSGTWSCVNTSPDEGIKTGRLKKFGRFLLSKIKPKRKD